MEIVNIVLSSNLGQEIDLNALSKKVVKFRYNPEKYHGGYLKLEKYTATIYKSGKYIVPGVKSFDDFNDISLQMSTLLQSVLDISKFSAPKPSNIVATDYLEEPIILSNLAISLMNLGYEISYEPESFPGLIFKSELGTSNIFSSGKYILLGTKDLESLYKLNQKVRSVIANCLQ